MSYFGGMIKWVFLISIMLLVVGSCENRSETITIVGNGEAYMCDQYEIDDVHNYGFAHQITYKLKLIQLKKDSKGSNIDPIKVVDNINKSLAPINAKVVLSSNISLVKEQLNSKKVRYRDLLNSYWSNGGYGFISMIVVPDDIKLEEGDSIGGAASGIPDPNNVSKGKPVFFVKKQFAYNQITSHELYHVFGLYHIFHLNQYVQDYASCSTNDRVKDSPTPGLNHGYGNETCRYYPGNNDEHLTEEDKKIIVQNYLSYSAPYCKVNRVLTEGQIERVRKVMSVDPLLQSAELRDETYDIFVSE